MPKSVIISLAASFLLGGSVLAHKDHTSHEHSSNAEDSHQENNHQQAVPSPITQIAVKVSRPLEKDKEVLTTITLTSKKNGKAINPVDLKEVHTENVHLLVFDQTLNDYQYIHPTPSSKPGVYTFTWTPRREGFYRMWADLVPTSTNQQEYAVVDIPATVKEIYPVEKNLTSKTIEGELTYTLSFDKPSPKVGESLLGEVNIVDKEGNPFQNLEPVMGTFAHIVAVSEDFQTVEHVHPLGAENPKPMERGGPKMQFHITPSKAGYLKIYVQVQIQGIQHFIPFGIQVAP